MNHSPTGISGGLGRAFLAMLALFACACALAQTCASPGLNGPATATGVINSYHPGVGTASAGGSTVDVAFFEGLRTVKHDLTAGDMVLIVQMQDSATPANAGRYEYAHVASVSGVAPARLTLRSPLVNSYVQDVSPGPPSRVKTFQVIWVPQYSSLVINGTVRAERWQHVAGINSATGGIVAFDVAGALTMGASGRIDAAGAGFRGGAGFNGTCGRSGAYTDADYPYAGPAYFCTPGFASNGALKGEGIEGTPVRPFDNGSSSTTYTTLFGEGYAAGAMGRGARSNAGGGGNDGIPPTGGNNYNSGGGGGGNVGGGGQGGNSWNDNVNGGTRNETPPGNMGWPAGGLGGQAQAVSATRLVMGGGGGAGSANNGGTESVTQWPPTATGTGALGAIASSGASGGGIVLVRAGSFAASVGATIDASGYRAYDKYPDWATGTSNTDGGGGGGAGGSVYLMAGSGGGAGLSINAGGGAGGSTDYLNHGPGGGGGGGYIQTSLSAAALNVSGGANGLDGCCGGTTGPSGQQAYNSTPGSAGATSLVITPPSGVLGGAQCLPALTLAKSTTTPQRTVPAETTAQYVITITNPASGSGAAYGVAVRDVLPVPFGLTSTVASASYAVAGAGTRFSNAAPSVPNSSGVTSTVQFGTPGGMTNTFIIFPGGEVTLTFIVMLNTSTSGIYQNSATFSFIDPTRATGVTATAVNMPANPTVSPGQAYAAGGTVGGSNYDSASGTGEDVKLIATTKLTVAKTNGVTSLASGQTTSYTITVANMGPAGADGTVLRDPVATGLSCTTVTCAIGGGGAVCPTSTPPNTLLTDLQAPGLTLSTFPASSSLTFNLTCTVTATGL